VFLQVSGEWADFIKGSLEKVKDVCIISVLSICDDTDSMPELVFQAGEEIPELSVAVQAAKGDKCERCWTRDTFVGSNADHPQLCERCLGVVMATEIQEQ
jgi:isoleucyl-tRNA synthetase